MTHSRSTTPKKAAIMINPEFIDIAYKTGCGRYVQAAGALDLLCGEVSRLGKRAFVISGKNSWEASGQSVTKVLDSEGMLAGSCIYTGEVCDEGFDELAEKFRENDADVLVGVGGGRIMDTAKCVAMTLDAPVVEVPSSIATCACFSTMNVVYNMQGYVRGTWRMDREVDAIVVDLATIANAPARLLAAGALDSIAKAYEIPNGRGDLVLGEDTFNRFCAYSYAKTNNEILFADALSAYDACKNCDVTEELEHVAFVNLALTGVVAALTKNVHQTALAHSFYDGVRKVYGKDKKNWLHGELVAVGLRLQALFNGQEKEEAAITDLMSKMNMPISIEDLEIATNDEKFEELTEFISTSKFVDDDSRQTFVDAFKRIEKR